MFYKFKNTKNNEYTVIDDGRVKTLRNGVVFKDRKIPLNKINEEVTKYRNNKKFIEIEMKI